MGISLFYLPAYKNMTHASQDCFLRGKAPSCHGTQLEDFLPIWEKLTSGKFSGSQMKLKKKIYDKEYRMYPIIFITSECWPETKDRSATSNTFVHIVETQNQNIEHCKSFEHRYIDREVGVIILEKTILHENAKEPVFKNWFYEKDTREDLPENILFENFSFVTDNPGSYPMQIKKFITDETFDCRYGYLSGEAIQKLFKDYMGENPIVCDIRFIEWDDSWNFVLHNYYGDKMFKVNTKDALAFLERNNISFEAE